MTFDFDKESVFLVTGGAGFIGSNLCETLLGYGFKTKCLDNLSTGHIENLSTLLSDPNFEFIEGDIRDFDLCDRICKGVNYVLHQAAWGSVPRSIEFPLLYEEINVRGTVNMMEAARKNKAKKFIYASSSSVYGDEVTLPKVEGKEGKVLSPYALTKRTNEEYGRLYYKLYGLHTVGLRYFNVFGKNQDPNGSYAAVIPKFIMQLLENQTPILHGDGMQSRDFTYIENVIEANLKACAIGTQAAGQVFNIAYGGREYLLDVYISLCGLLKKEYCPVFGPERPGDIKHSNADISKAKCLLGYNPQVDFKKGLLLTIDWYKNRYLSMER